MASLFRRRIASRRIGRRRTSREMQEERAVAQFDESPDEWTGSRAVYVRIKLSALDGTTKGMKSIVCSPHEFPPYNP